MKRVTRWSPDTCDCVLEYEWDDAQDENSRVHTFKKVVKLCPEHEKLGFKDKAVFDQVLSENTRRNITWGLVQKELNLTGEDIDKYLWFFDKDRNLQISVLGIEFTSEKKSKLQLEFDKQFGKLKVKVL